MNFCGASNGAKREQDDGMISLINIVFLMLIFFMVAGQIQRSDAIKLDPPVSSSETQQRQDKVTVLVGGDGALWFEHKAIDDQGLAAELNTALAAAESPEQMSILVKVGGTLEVARLQEVLREIKRAGFRKVSLATQRVESQP